MFNYDDLGNRLTLNTRGDQDVAYLHNVANEYTGIRKQSVGAAGWAYGPRASKPLLPKGRSVVSREFPQPETCNLKPETYYYYAHNHLYSPVALMEDDGDVVERYEYDVYGKPYFYNSTLTALLDPQKSGHNNPVMFTGQRFDRLDNGDLQLMYYKNRFYCTNTGRFLQRDPIEYEDGMNFYEYVNSNPIINSDTYGLFSEAIYSGDLRPPKPRKKCGNCGPDITNELQRLTANLEFKMRGWTPEKREKFCYARINIANGNTLISWDIEEIKFNWADRMKRFPGCATGDCKDTVQVNGRCQDRNEVNYYWGGLLTGECAAYYIKDIRARQRLRALIILRAYARSQKTGIPLHISLPQLPNLHPLDPEEYFNNANIYTRFSSMLDGASSSCKLAWLKEGARIAKWGKKTPPNVTCGNKTFCKIDECKKHLDIAGTWTVGTPAKIEEVEVIHAEDPIPEKRP